LEAAAQRPVLAVVAGAGVYEDDTQCDVFVGTEALLHRVRRIDVVAFLDFDAELLAPRFRAGEQAFALLARAARLVGPRRGGGRIVIQTTLIDHPVVEAAREGNPSIISDSEEQRRKILRLPPYSAMAVVEGAGAEQFATAIAASSPLVSVVPYRDRWLVRAADHETLSAACSSVDRLPGSKIRIEVDPPRL
jgi:primosomal protein N' (replication factor Y)